MFHACLEHVVESKYLAFLRDLNETQTGLTQVELGIDLRNLLGGIGRAKD